MIRTKWYAPLQLKFERLAPLAFEKFGVNAQFTKCLEEMGELTRALAKRMNGSPIDDKDVVDEIADVLIMANQLRFHFGAETVDERMYYKLGRLERYLYTGEFQK